MIQLLSNTLKHESHKMHSRILKDVIIQKMSDCEDIIIIDTIILNDPCEI